MVRALKVCVEFDIEAVTCPGTVLVGNGSIYVELHLFKSLLRSEPCRPIFPVLLHSRLSSSKIFPKIIDPGELATLLSTQIVSVRLMQESNLGDIILAQYAANAREFLFPTPRLTDHYPGVEREILLTRTSAYNGLLEPKIEFSSRTTIREVTARPRHAKKNELALTSGGDRKVTDVGKVRGTFEMSKSDERLTRTVENNLRRAKDSQRRPRSPVRRSQNPRYMNSTVSFRAKSPDRSKRTGCTKSLPFLTGGQNDYNLSRYMNRTKRSDDTDSDDYEEGTTYENIRKRISKLLHSPRAKRINKNGELSAQLARLNGENEADESAVPRVKLSEKSTWSEDASKLRGESFRQTFDASLREIYGEMESQHSKEIEK